MSATSGATPRVTVGFGDTNLDVERVEWIVAEIVNGEPQHVQHQTRKADREAAEEMLRRLIQTEPLRHYRIMRRVVYATKWTAVE